MPLLFFIAARRCLLIFIMRCHCEERSDVAISWWKGESLGGDCHGPAALAMTEKTEGSVPV